MPFVVPLHWPQERQAFVCSQYSKTVPFVVPHRSPGANGSSLGQPKVARLCLSLAFPLLRILRLLCFNGLSLAARYIHSLAVRPCSSLVFFFIFNVSLSPSSKALAVSSHTHRAMHRAPPAWQPTAAAPGAWERARASVEYRALHILVKVRLSLCVFAGFPWSSKAII